MGWVDGIKNRTNARFRFFFNFSWFMGSTHKFSDRCFGNKFGKTFLGVTRLLSGQSAWKFGIDCLKTVACWRVHLWSYTPGPRGSGAKLFVIFFLGQVHDSRKFDLKMFWKSDCTPTPKTMCLQKLILIALKLWPVDARNKQGDRKQKKTR